LSQNSGTETYTVSLHFLVIYYYDFIQTPIEVVPSVINMSPKRGEGVDEILLSTVICLKKNRSMRNKGYGF